MDTNIVKDKFVTGNLYFDIARGVYEGMLSVNKFGRNMDIDYGSTPEDLWSYGGIWVPPTTGQVHTIVSSSSDDSEGGSGLRSVHIDGLDENWKLASEVVTMNGTTGVDTTTKFVRIFRMYGMTAGSQHVNIGNITATAKTDGTVTAYIAEGHGQTLMAIYTIPSGYTGYMVSFWGSMNRPGSTSAAICTFSLVARQNADTSNYVDRIQKTGGLTLNSTSNIREWITPNTKVPEKTDIIMRCDYSSDNNMDVSGGFDLILDKN